MPVSIVSNLASNYAQQAIQTRNVGMQVATQRLSSGQRVFRADQDAAAMAVGTSLKIETSSLRQAQQNVTSGVSMLQIADGALGQISDIMNRLQTLATQAGSGQLGDVERGLLDREFQTLKLEIDRIANDTEFNGTAMLAGQAQFGLQGAHTYAADGIVNLQFDQTKINTDAVLKYSYDAATEQLTVRRVDGTSGGSQTVDLTNLLDSLAGPGQQLGAGQQLPINFSGIGVTLTLGPTFDRAVDIQPDVTDNTAPDVTVTAPLFVAQATNLPVGTAAALQALGGAYNHNTGVLTLDVDSDGASVTLGGIAGISYAVNGGAVGASGAGSASLTGAGSYVDFYVDDGAGGRTLLGRLSADSIATSGAGTGTLGVPVGQGLIGATYNGNGGGVQLTYKVGTGVVAGQDLLNITVPPATQSSLGLTTLSLTSVFGANVALDAIRNASTVLNATRATIGAQQIRMESIGRTLGVNVENNEAARSSLMDADVASEITNLTNDQAMLQVGVSMLSQSNKIADYLLQMLRNG